MLILKEKIEILIYRNAQGVSVAFAGVQESVW